MLSGTCARCGGRLSPPSPTSSARDLAGLDVTHRSDLCPPKNSAQDKSTRKTTGICQLYNMITRRRIGSVNRVCLQETFPSPQ